MLKLVVIASVARACSLSSAEREDRMVGGGVAAEPGCKCVLMSSSAQREWEREGTSFWLCSCDPGCCEF